MDEAVLRIVVADEGEQQRAAPNDLYAAFRAESRRTPITVAPREPITSNRPSGGRNSPLHVIIAGPIPLSVKIAGAVSTEVSRRVSQEMAGAPREPFAAPLGRKELEAVPPPFLMEDDIIKKLLGRNAALPAEHVPGVPMAIDILRNLQGQPIPGPAPRFSVPAPLKSPISMEIPEQRPLGTAEPFKPFSPMNMELGPDTQRQNKPAGAALPAEHIPKPLTSNIPGSLKGGFQSPDVQYKNDPLFSMLATHGTPFIGGAAKIGAGIATENPLAIASGILEIADDFKKAMVGAVDSVGNFSIAMASASSSPGDFISSMGQQISAVSDSIPVIGIFGSVVGKATEKLGQFLDALDQNVERYSRFSPIIGIAQGQAQMVQTLGDLRRAQELGPSLAAYIAKRTELQQKIEDAKMRFMIRIMPTVLRLMEIFEEHVLPLIEGIANGIAKMSGVAANAGDDLGEIGRLLKDMNTAGVADPLGDIMMGYVPPGASGLTRDVEFLGQEFKFPETRGFRGPDI